MPDQARIDQGILVALSAAGDLSTMPFLTSSALPQRDPKLFFWLVLFGAVLLLLGLAHAWVNPWLWYETDAIAAGQLWRLWTAHLVHINHWHLAMNLGGFALCCYFFTDIYTRRLLLVWLLCAPLFVSLMMLGVDDTPGTYVGLSGVLHGWLILALLVGFRTHPWVHALVLVLISGRLIWEQLPAYDADYLQGWIDGSVYVNAHLYGAMAGALQALGVIGLRRYRAGGGAAGADHHAG